MDLSRNPQATIAKASGSWERTKGAYRFFDDTQERKPSAKPFLKVLELLNTEPGEALMVGDWAERDIVGAKAVGMRTAFARYGDVLGTQVHGADFDLHDINDLLDIVDRENK